MKWSHSFLLCFLLLPACSQKKEIPSLAMPVSNTIEILDSDTHEDILLKAAHIVPTPNQYEALRNEFIAFIHFGPNTFTRMEWGNGMENPTVIDLQNLDTDQWCQTMKEAGMKMVIFTAKHHDGFVLWQSRYTQHGIMSSPFKKGQGDVLKELAASCAQFGLKLGVYLSPADLFQIESATGLYGNQSLASERTIPSAVEGRPFKNKTTFSFTVDDYNEYFLNQLFELLTEYGPIHEVWFDGAHPKRKGGQTYNYLAWKELIRTLAPEAVIFGKEDIRWCGNEAGKTRDTEWNVIPYREDPNTMNSFDDLTAASLGSRTDLYQGKFLHYQQAETNTSIREGWFYRDDDEQKVRNADDVLDIYERAVGGNSTFLLNIPPNREGSFSKEDVSVLRDVGERITETYGNNILSGAKGPENLLDDNRESFELFEMGVAEFTITTPSPITLNRFVLQEAITTHGERVEEHALDAWIDNGWKEIAAATSIGYKRILRFPEVTSDTFRVRILASRFYPALSNIAAHYYEARPPQLSITRTMEGQVTIRPRQHSFGWNPHGEDASGNINSGYKIYYTTDGSEPNKDSKVFEQPFGLSLGIVKAQAGINQKMGSTSSQLFGIVKKDWSLIDVDSEQEKHGGSEAFDADENTFWQSQAKGSIHYLAIDLGKAYRVTGFVYTPQTVSADGMLEQGTLKISDDGKSWRVVEDFKFGNLINDPTARRHNFKNAVMARFIRIESKKIAGDGNTLRIAELDFLMK